MEKLMAFFSVLRKGSEVADPEAWKAKQITGNVMGGLILALVTLAKAFGYELPVDEPTALVIGGGVVAIVNVVLTAATSKRAGILPAKPQPVSEQAVVSGTGDSIKDGSGNNLIADGSYWDNKDHDPGKL